MDLLIDVLIAKVVVIVGFGIVEASLAVRTAGGGVTWSIRIEIEMKVSSTFCSRSGGSVGGIILWPKHLTGNVVTASAVRIYFVTIDWVSVDSAINRLHWNGTRGSGWGDYNVRVELLCGQCLLS